MRSAGFMRCDLMWSLGSAQKLQHANHIIDADSLQAAYGPRLWSQLRLVFGADSAGWFARDPLRRAERLVRTRAFPMPLLYADSGTEDFLLGQNRLFRDGLRALGIELAYAEYPGAHSWDYWRRHAAHSARWLAQQLSVR